jgi:hypothetical protein
MPFILDMPSKGIYLVIIDPDEHAAVARRPINCLCGSIVRQLKTYLLRARFRRSVAPGLSPNLPRLCD